MDKNKLYDIETEIYKKLDCIKKEQEQYAAGIEKGIDMTVNAVRKALNSEESQRNASDCPYCNFKTDVGEDFPGHDGPFRIQCYKNDNGKREYRLTVDGSYIFHACKIRYCPICGRLLESEG